MSRYVEEEVVRSVGRRVRELRLLHRWTQNDLAMRLRAAVQRVQNIERGAENLTLFSLSRLANALDVPIETFFAKAVAAEEPGPRVGRPRRLQPSVVEGVAKRPVRKARTSATKKRSTKRPKRTSR